MIVSILTRPVSRVQLVIVRASHCGPFCFNPHPAREPGATTTPLSTSRSMIVSILTRPVSRVQHRGCWTKTKTASGFNPHPAREPGATPPWSTWLGTSGKCFNPHPAREPGATLA